MHNIKKIEIKCHMTLLNPPRTNLFSHSVSSAKPSCLPLPWYLNPLPIGGKPLSHDLLYPLVGILSNLRQPCYAPWWAYPHLCDNRIIILKYITYTDLGTRALGGITFLTVRNVW